MAQLSLYIDEDTLKKVERTAKMQNLSLSKYVVKAIRNSLDTSWPDSFDNLYGAINDDSFEPVAKSGSGRDIPREKL